MYKKYIPDIIKDFTKPIMLKQRFPGSVIKSKEVSLSANLSKCFISEGVNVRQNVEIGDYSFINVDTLIRSGKIGRYTSIGPRCQIGMPEHPIDHMSTSPYIYDRKRSILNIDSWQENHSAPIIGNDVWIGANAVVLQGVSIGNGAIIGAGAIVTKNVDPYSVVGGVPAKLIRKRFDDGVIEYLQDLTWWNMTLDELEKFKKKFETGSDWQKMI